MHIFENFIEIFFPASFSYHIVKNENKETIKRFLRPLEVNGVISLGSYHESSLKACLVAAKFEHNTYALDLLGAFVSNYLENLPPDNTLLIPIPLHTSRQRQRGYNQVTEVLKRAIVHRPNYQLDTHLLQRQRATPPQTSLNRKARLKNLEGAFVLENLNKIKWENITRVIICDDVLTTGATLAAARATLAPHLPHHITLSCLAFAH